MTVCIIGTNTQNELTADELLNSREKEWREFAGTQGEREDAQPCPRHRSGAELGTELRFLMSLGLAMALTIFIWEKAPAAFLQWCPPMHEQKVHSYMYIIRVFLLKKANQAADWKSRTDTCDECTMGQRVIVCNEICQFKS